jgi:restriction system protein
MPRRARQPTTGLSSILVILARVVVLAVISLWKLLWKPHQLRRAQEIIAAHAEELRRHRKQLRVEGNYGLVDDSRWHKEKELFQARVVKPKLNRFFGYDEKRIDRAIEEVAASASTTNCAFRPDMEPLLYEQFVADLLGHDGWSTRLTRASGDQGIDVVAQRGNVKAVIQCKLYSQPVGNSAVQEVMGGRAYENANIAAVVTNAGFTRAARELASTAGVLLLHHDELAKLDSAAGGGPTRDASRAVTDQISPRRTIVHKAPGWPAAAICGAAVLLLAMGGFREWIGRAPHRVGIAAQPGTGAPASGYSDTDTQPSRSRIRHARIRPTTTSAVVFTPKAVSTTDASYTDIAASDMRHSRAPEAADAVSVDDLTAVSARDPRAAQKITTYCASATAQATDPMTAGAACQRDEVAAWTRLVLDNEFPALDPATRRICSQPPFPDSYEGMESCVRYELRTN